MRTIEESLKEIGKLANELSKQTDLLNANLRQLQCALEVINYRVRLIEGLPVVH